MKIFKNSVGRPSNETLRKRKIFIISAITVLAFLTGVGIFIGVKYVRGDMNSGLFNLSSSPITIKIVATNAKTGKELGTYKNQSVSLSGWRNYTVGFNVEASSKNNKITTIEVRWNSEGHATEQKALTTLGKGKKTIKGNAAYFDFTGEGIRYANVTARDSKGNSRSITVRVDIDKTVPTLRFTPEDRSDESYVFIEVKCSDKMSGIVEMETKKVSAADYQAYKGNAVETKSQSLAFTEEKNQKVTTICKDAAGNLLTINKNVDNMIKQNSNISNAPNVTITAINLTTNSDIKMVKNKSLLLAGWRSHKVRFKVAASSKDSTIKSIEWKYNKSGINSTKASNYSTWVANKTYNSATVALDYTGEGARSGVVIVTDKKGRQRVVQIGANIDYTAPTVKLSWETLQSAGNGNYVVGAVGKVKCSDSLSGVKQVIAHEGLNNSNKTSGKSESTIIIKKTGNNYFDGFCYDNAGNKSSKKSTKHNYVEKYTLSVSGVSGNATSWTNKSVTLKVSASSSNGLATNGYSFDNGKTWQKSNAKTFSTNQTVKIKVKDKKGNVSVAKTINITKIDKTIPTITFTMKSAQQERGKYPSGARVEVNCTDKESEVTYLESWSKSVPNNRNSAGSLTAGVGQKTRTLNMVFIASGTSKKMQATCYDKAGNSVTATSKGWTISK